MAHNKEQLISMMKSLASVVGFTVTENELIEETVVKSTEDPIIEVPVLKALNEEEQICIEIVYSPDVKDLHGEWMTEDEIVKGEESFSRNLEAGVVKANLFHVTTTDKFSIKKSWVLPEDTKFEGREELVTKGTWLNEVHYADAGLWEMKKSNELGGLSFGGYGHVNKSTGEIKALRFEKSEYKEALVALQKEGNA